jgi:hypothetical protein
MHTIDTIFEDESFYIGRAEQVLMLFQLVNLFRVDIVVRLISEGRINLILSLILHAFRALTSRHSSPSAWLLAYACYTCR